MSDKEVTIVLDAMRQMETRIDARFNSLDARLNTFDIRLSNIENRLSNVENRLANLETLVRKIERCVDIENTDIVPTTAFFVM